MLHYTAKYIKTKSGYMGQLVEWPEVVTEGDNLEQCRAMLRDALKQMVLAYQDLGREIPEGNRRLSRRNRPLRLTPPLEIGSISWSDITWSKKQNEEGRTHRFAPTGPMTV